MQFLSPIWFFALAAVAIPVMIHLWNIRPGKTLKVGSISLITEASKVSRRSFKLLDILLLILRCLLLILLAIFLAAPVWRRYLAATKTKGWILIPKEEFKETYNHFKPQVDSLTEAGYEFHYFNKGFAKGDLKTLPLDTLRKDTISTANYWGLVQQLDSKLTGGMPVSLFTDNNLDHFKGLKPAIPVKLSWQTYTPADSTATWLAGAYLTGGDAIQVLRANSNPLQTWYTTETIAGNGNAGIALEVDNGHPKARLKSGVKDTVPVDTSVMRIAIYTDKYQIDANYLTAALKAVTSFTGRKSVIRLYADAAKIPAGQTWLFWLSDKPVPSSRSKNIFKYESGKEVNAGSWINAGGDQVKLFKSIISADDNESVWQDGYGRPVLSVERKQANTYRFYTHFNPLWNDLAWSDEFPKMLLGLLYQQTDTSVDKYERRVLSNRQIQPQLVSGAKPHTLAGTAENTDLSRYFWLALATMFVAERLLSYRTKQVTNG